MSDDPVIRRRKARHKTPKTEPLIVGEETRRAIEEARRGGLPSFADVEALMRDLNAGD